jgi:hypothetical protein
VTGQKEQYRSVDTGYFSLPEGNVISYSTYKDLFQVYSTNDVHLLSHCKEFRSLESHAKAFIYKRQAQVLSQPSRFSVGNLQKYLRVKLLEAGLDFPISNSQIRKVQQQLEQFARDGFLVSGTELRNSVLKAVSSFNISIEGRTTIQNIGIPTRNRGELLIHCIKALLEQTQLNNRTCTLHIIYDSESHTNSDRHRGIVKQLCKNNKSDLFWMDRQHRYSLVRRIAKNSETPPDITAFALLGDPRCGLRTGSSRNTLLALSAGEPSLQIDDDVICRMLPSPWKEGGIALASESECRRYEFYKNNERIELDQSDRIKEDFFSLHETMLGKHPAELIRDEPKVNIDKLGGSLLDKLGKPDTRIVTSCLGSWGDSGMYRHWQRLGLEGETFQRLVSNKSFYQDYLCTRKLLRTPAQTTIGDSPFCMAMNIGLDTSRLLPPFMPVQRNQDGIFGQLLYLCFKQACRGYLPYAIIHNPPDRPTQVDLTFALSVGPLRTPDVLQAILWSLSQWPFGDDPAKNLFVVGTYLSDLGQLPLSQFKGKVRELCWQLIRNQMNYLHRCLDERYDAPGYWQADVKQVLSNFKELMKQEDLCIPCDLPGSATERLELFRELVGKFGQVLIHWPAMWEAAVNLNKNSEMSKQASMFE